MKKIILFATLFISAININADNLKEQLQKQNALINFSFCTYNEVENALLKIKR